MQAREKSGVAQVPWEPEGCRNLSGMAVVEG